MSKGEALLVFGAAVMTLNSLSERLKTVKYKIESEKVNSSVRLCLISDLHSSRYGDRQIELIRAIEKECPDIVLMAGDMIDNRFVSKEPYRLCKELANRYMCFFVTGNHEFYNGRDEIIKSRLRRCGIRVLEGEAFDFSVRGEKAVVFGVDDIYIPIDNKKRLWEDQFELAKKYSSTNFSILLTHRPELAELYSETNFDLIVAGHAHGGQVIVPGLLNGLYSPNQGLFPKYAGGIFTLKDGQNMIVSRGLSKFNRPRVFNRPEIVIIDIVPKVG